jgi:hypothetical protein
MMRILKMIKVKYNFLIILSQVKVKYNFSYFTFPV